MKEGEFGQALSVSSLVHLADVLLLQLVNIFVLLYATCEARLLCEFCSFERGSSPSLVWSRVAVSPSSLCFRSSRSLSPSQAFPTRTGLSLVYVLASLPVP